jgi:hypothetical protein
MECEKIEEIGVRMIKILEKNREDFYKCSLAKTLAKDRLRKLLR